MRAYIMSTIQERFLCFGDNPVAASEHLRAFGVDPQTVSVSQGFPIPEAGLAVTIGRDFPFLRLADGRGVQGRQEPGDMA